MAAPPAYLDHCLDQRIAVRLRQRGFTVTTTYAEGNATLRDEDQLVFAATRGSVLVTHNKVDYQRHHRHWASQGRQHGGIIAIPQGSLARVELRIAMLLDWIGESPPAPSSLLLWRDLQRHLEQGTRLVGYSESEVRFVLGWPSFDAAGP